MRSSLVASGRRHAALPLPCAELDMVCILVWGCAVQPGVRSSLPPCGPRPQPSRRTGRKMHPPVVRLARRSPAAERVSEPQSVWWRLVSLRRAGAAARCRGG